MVGALRKDLQAFAVDTEMVLKSVDERCFDHKG